MLFLKALFLNIDFSKTAPTSTEELQLKNNEFQLGEVEMSHKRKEPVREKPPRRKTLKLHL